MLNAKEDKIDEKKIELEQQNNKVEAILKQQEQKLIEIAALTKDEARTIIMDQVRETMSIEIATYIKEEEEKVDEVILIIFISCFFVIFTNFFKKLVIKVCVFHLKPLQIVFF